MSVRIFLLLLSAFTVLTAMERPQQDTSDWFAFTPHSDATQESAVAMNEWLHKPAGQHGFLQYNKDKLEFEDGTPITFWGTNVEYMKTGPKHEEGKKAAAFFAKYGVNIVRLHKMTNPGWEGLGSRSSASVYDPAAIERLDYFTNEMKKNGVYFGFSPIWDLKIFPEDKKKLIAYDELKGPGNGNTQGAVWFADDVQDLHIETMLNLITHKNKYTGKTYAKDPALAYIEIQNEEDIFFYTTLPKLQKLPTYRKIAAKKFSAWLKKKYKSQDALLKAWGAGSLNAFPEFRDQESLAADSIVPALNPWFLENRLNHPQQGKRLLDTLAFCYDMQNAFYSKMTKAIRKAGFKGCIVSGNWQAGNGVGHYANLMSDREHGIIDRHNYMGGTGKYNIQNGFNVNTITMLNNPGSALLSTGSQQVADRPFMLSEWLSIQPNHWAAADTTIIAAYGMGLQGWDVSFHFASNHHGFTKGFYEGHNNKVFNNQTPMGFGIYPALARMVIRGDVTEADIVARRNVSAEQIFTHTLPFSDKVAQHGDVKSFAGDVDPRCLAVGRVVVDFTKKSESFKKPSINSHINGNTITSSTGELAWHTPKSGGWISINTKGTQAVAGFVPNSKQEFDDCSINLKNDYGLVFVSAAESDKTIKKSKRLLITVQAYCQQSGQQIRNGKVIQIGRPPILMQPVQADISLKNKKTATVYVLNQDGQRTDKTIAINKGTFSIDTANDKTLYYEVVYK